MADHDETYSGSDSELEGRFSFAMRPWSRSYPQRRGRTRRQRPFQEPFNSLGLPTELQLKIVEQVSGAFSEAEW